MKKPWFGIVTMVSALFVLLTIVLWAATFFISPWDHRLSISKEFHIGVWSGFSGDTLGRLVFFNDSKYGPYRGSIVTLANEDYPPKNESWFIGIGGFGMTTDYDGKGAIEIKELECDLPGVYYRHFTWVQTGGVIWTLMISFWYPLLVFGILPMVWYCRHLGLRKKRKN